MDINKSFTLEELNKTMDSLRPRKEVHVNTAAYNKGAERLGYESSNLVINEYIPSEQAFALDIEELKNSFKPKLFY